MSNPCHACPRAEGSKALASIAFIGMSQLLLGLYNTLHWGVLFGQHPAVMPQDARRQLILLLDEMDLQVRALALLGIVFAAWSFHGRPGWLTWAAFLMTLLLGLPTLLLIT